MEHLDQTEPGSCLDVVLACLRHITTPDQASLLAAGPLEDVIADHGPMVIGLAETLSRQSARFRYLLSGVWPRGQDVDGPVWHRVMAARAPGPGMDAGTGLPAIDF